ncbi:imidazoleglycerol-phosphate dehydratase HisB [uncultured Methanofollis sp.]|uniref:imidazoleglycerol-phosphate dehydratase HisB n=1 Tax=uncultured Methanofollis sp. TaxID=262500 RepID=UPI00261C73A4|nr:imidazoleglycerol-phosphate dehydratase HisB [uncultured Methanofollis sp.]
MRMGEVKRETKETKIDLRIALDGEGGADIATGLPFMDHMLNSFARHGGFGLSVHAKGDLEVDAHHLVEDLGIVLGTALKEAVGDGAGITRFADAAVPMDEALAEVAIDVGGRGYLVFTGDFNSPAVGGVDTTLFEHFFYSLCTRAGITVHIRFYGRNDHHMAEAIFKAFGVALAKAVAIDPRRSGGVPSTKGTL